MRKPQSNRTLLIGGVAAVVLTGNHKHQADDELKLVYRIKAPVSRERGLPGLRNEVEQLLLEEFKAAQRSGGELLSIPVSLISRRPSVSECGEM